jgi:5-methylcytosine-specific restriction enzyme A
LESASSMPATICDHVEPHRGDVNTFWLGPFMSLR